MWQVVSLGRITYIKEHMTMKMKDELRDLVHELYLEGELRLQLSTDEYDAERHRMICELEAEGLVAFHHNVANADGGFDQILHATEFCNQVIAANWDMSDLNRVDANVCIGFAATWQVEAAAEIEALASEEGVTQLSKGLPKQFRNNPRYRDWMDKLMEMSATGG
jgi:hypothetical protein